MQVLDVNVLFSELGAIASIFETTDNVERPKNVACHIVANCSNIVTLLLSQINMSLIGDK